MITITDLYKSYYTGPCVISLYTDEIFILNIYCIAVTVDYSMRIVVLEKDYKNIDITLLYDIHVNSPLDNCIHSGYQFVEELKPDCQICLIKRSPIHVIN